MEITLRYFRERAALYRDESAKATKPIDAERYRNIADLLDQQAAFFEIGRDAGQKCPAMPSAENLRAEVRRLLREAQGFIDPKLKQELASHAFELAQRAERIDVLVADPGRLEGEIARYHSRLRDASLSPAQRRIVRDALADAEPLLARLLPR